MKYRGLRYNDLNIDTKRLIVASRDAQMKVDALEAAMQATKALWLEAVVEAEKAHAALNKEWNRRSDQNRFILGDYTLGLDPSYYGDEDD